MIPIPSKYEITHVPTLVRRKRVCVIRRGPHLRTASGSGGAHYDVDEDEREGGGGGGGGVCSACFHGVDGGERADERPLLQRAKHHGHIRRCDADGHFEGIGQIRDATQRTLGSHDGASRAHARNKHTRPLPVRETLCGANPC